MSLPVTSSRRQFLRGLGASIALPTLHSLLPGTARAAAAAQAAAPRRMAFMFVPNGVHLPDWRPAETGTEYTMPWSLEPLRPHRADFSIMTGLAQDKGWANNDGGGDHARSATSWLTGSQPLKSEGSQIRAGISADQFVARSIGNKTRFSSLELSLEPGRQAGKCDTGYACVYSNNISWRNETTPMAREINPRLVFERLFGTAALKGESGEGASRRAMLRKSVLDFVMQDAAQLRARAGGTDRVKLDEYLESIREIEKRVEQTERMMASARPIIGAYEIPEEIPESYEEHAHLMMDMMVLAFQTDTTRVASLMLANEGSNRSYRNVGVNDGHHGLSHHQGDRAKHLKIREINRFHLKQFSYFLGKLKSIREGDGTLLDNSMIVFGAGIGDGDRHNHNDLPLILAGRGGGTITQGRHIRFNDETPMCNLLVGMMDRMGVDGTGFGDSTGPLRGLQG